MAKRRDECFRALHPASGRYFAAHGGDHAFRYRRLLVPSALDASPGRLSDDPGADLLSRRQPGSDDIISDRSLGAAVRANARTEPDDLGELRRRFDHYPSVHPQSQPRRRRAGGPGGNQCGGESAPERSARSAGLRQGQPRGRADPDARGHLEKHVVDRSRGSERDAAGAEDFAALRRRPGQHQRRPPPGRAHPVQPAGARRLRPQHRRRAHHRRQLQRQHAEGKFRRAGASHDHQRQ